MEQKSRGRKRTQCNDCYNISVKLIRKNYFKKWYETVGQYRKRNNTGSNSIKIMEWKRQNPEKVYAHKQVANALRNGILKNPGECYDCKSKTNYLDAHHTDYKQPLLITWLCPKCHKARHTDLIASSRAFQSTPPRMGGRPRKINTEKEGK